MGCLIYKSVPVLRMHAFPHLCLLSVLHLRGSERWLYSPVLRLVLLTPPCLHYTVSHGLQQESFIITPLPFHNVVRTFLCTFIHWFLLHQDLDWISGVLHTLHQWCPDSAWITATQRSQWVWCTDKSVACHVADSTGDSEKKNKKHSYKHWLKEIKFIKQEFK